MVETHLSEIRIDPITNGMAETEYNTTQEQNDAHSSWLSSIMEDVEDAEDNQPQEAKIPMVPNEFVKNNKECYNPLVVSIGPYYYSDRRNKFKEVERLKIPMARQFVLDCPKRTEHPQRNIERLYHKVKEVAPRARGFYAECSTNGFSEEQFAQMVFLDGCFILQFINCVTGNRANLKMSDQQVADVKRDLLLLENQLPFLVLKSLIELRYEKHENSDDGMKIIYEFLVHQIHKPGHQPLPIWARRLLSAPWLLILLASTFLCLEIILIGASILLLGVATLFGMMLSLIFSKRKRISSWLLRSLSVRRQKKKKALRYGDHLPPDQQPTHLLEFLYFILLGHEKREKTKPSDAPTRSRDHRLYYSAKDLKKVGIHFLPSKICALSNVKFSSSIFYATLSLPRITIDESTRAMFLNLMAYETCAAHEQLWVTSYVCFMDSLIDDAEDVKELRSKGILFNSLGPDQEVADLINLMGSCLESNYNISVYNDVEREINRQCEGTVTKWIAEWQRTYFSSPWAFTAFVAVGVGLGLTATQTYYTMHPPKEK